MSSSIDLNLARKEIKGIALLGETTMKRSLMRDLESVLLVQLILNLSHQLVIKPRLKRKLKVVQVVQCFQNLKSKQRK
jgi:hypothetical protein